MSNTLIMSKTRYIDIRRSTDRVFGGRNVHDLRFSIDGNNWYCITLTTKELRKLRRKLRIYLNTIPDEDDI